jgi:peptidyl-tRNA hydrolase, PTH1 family
MAPFRLIVGLGNPGREYSETRHNVGFMVLDRLAAGAGAIFRGEKKWRADVALAGSVLLCKPQTFMNLSGESVHALGHFYKIEPAQMLVVLDDMALPLGRLRIRENGSAGGHNGLKSIIAHLGTSAVPRLRIGIGDTGPGGASSHVLGRFALAERPALDDALGRAVEAIETAQREGITAAMTRFNHNQNTN